MASTAGFSLYALRFSFRALEPVHFPAGKSGNIIRGAFGLASPGQYTYSPLPARAPSGFANPPRPFIFRAAHLDSRTIQPGEHFDFDVHIFDLHEAAPASFVRIFVELGREGLGPGRGRAELIRADLLDAAATPESQLYSGGKLIAERPSTPLTLDLNACVQPVTRATVRFLTPTELKSGQELAERPEFPILFARIRDRISTLRALYGPGPLAIDFRAMAGRAAEVRLSRCELRHESVTRRSTRTGQSHPIGGFLGEAVYEGPLAEFLPYLHAARWTGVGRQTVWGKGAIEVEPPLPAR